MTTPQMPSMPLLEAERAAPDPDEVAAWLARCASDDAAIHEAIRAADARREQRMLWSEDDTLP